MKLFLIGRPGAGKSLAARLLLTLAQAQGQEAIHLDDYPILCKMYHQEGERTGRFCAVSQGDFDVLDHTIYDEALWTLEQHACESGKRAMLLIEFARDDYEHAFQQFSTDFLSGAFCLCIDTCMDTCLERIRARTACRMGHDLSLRVMQDYYHRQVLPTRLPMEIIDNNGTQAVFEEQVRQFAQRLLVA